MIGLGDEMLVVGGVRCEPGEVHVYQFKTQKWKQIFVRGLPSLYHHSMTRIGNTNRVMLFGGFSEDGSALNNMYVLDTAAWTCCEVNVQGDIPSPRGYHSALLLGKKVYLTSGTDYNSVQERMHALTHPFDSSGFESTLGMDLLKALDDEESADVCFVVEERQIFCHKIILSCRSDEMRALFSKDDPFDDSKRVIEIAPGPSYAVFMAMIRYLYCDRVTVTLENAKEMIDLATEYGLDQLRAIALSCTGDDIVIPPSRLNSDLGWALANPLLSDMTVSCEGVEIPCHRFILCQRSDYFRAMLSAGFREQTEGRVVIPDDGAIFSQVLKFIYTDTVNADPQTAFDLLCEAGLYRISNLLERCEQVLIDIIDLDSVIVLYEAADRYASPTLRDLCRFFINRHFWKLNEMDAFTELSPHLIQELLEFRRRHDQPLASLERLADLTEIDEDGYVDLEGVMCKHCGLPFVWMRSHWPKDMATPKDMLVAHTKGAVQFVDKILMTFQLGHLSAAIVDGKEFCQKKRHYGSKRDAQQNAALYTLHMINCFK